MLETQIKSNISEKNDPDRIVRTVCSPNCGGTCGINAYVKDDKIIKVEPADFPNQEYNRICLKGIAMAMQRNEHPDRIRYPMRRAGERGEGKWERISWDEAFNYLATNLSRISNEYGSRANSWLFMTGNYAVKSMTSSPRVANTLGGTLFSEFGLMGDLGSIMGFMPTLGGFLESNDWRDMTGAKLIILVGKNPADSSHSEIHFMFDAMEAGTRVVAIDPRFSRTAAKVDQWVPVRPGTDAALFLGMIHVVLEQDLWEREYVIQHTNAPFLVRSDNGMLLRHHDLVVDGDDAFMVWDASSESVEKSTEANTPELEHTVLVTLHDGSRIECRTGFHIMRQKWREYSPENVAKICDIPAETIYNLAIEYATTSPASIWMGYGAQRYHNGHLAFRAATTLGALCGNIGKPYAGVNGADGGYHHLVYMGIDNWIYPGGKKRHDYAGTRMFDLIETGDPYPVKSLWITHYGFGTQCAKFDRFVQDTLPHLELFVVTEQIMTDAARFADIVLPCVTYYEEELDIVGGGEMWNLQLRQRAIPPKEAKSDYEIYAELCKRMGHGEHWQLNAEEACRTILETHEDHYIKQVDWETLKREGVVELNIAHPHIPFGSMRFDTPSGKIELYTESLLKHGEAIARFVEPIESNRRPQAAKYPLTMMTHHSVHTTHGQHVMLPWIREMLPEPRLEMHPSDALPRNIKEGDWVKVFNDRGLLEVKVSLTEGIKPGAVTLPQGWWRKHYRKGHHNDLAHIPINPAQDDIFETNFPVWDILVEVEKMSEGVIT